MARIGLAVAGIGAAMVFTACGGDDEGGDGGGSDFAVRSTVCWSRSVTGSRLLLWLHADTSAFAERG